MWPPAVWYQEISGTHVEYLTPFRPRRSLVHQIETRRIKLQIQILIHSLWNTSHHITVKNSDSLSIKHVPLNQKQKFWFTVYEKHPNNHMWKFWFTVYEKHPIKSQVKILIHCLWQTSHRSHVKILICCLWKTAHQITSNNSDSLSVKHGPSNHEKNSDSLWNTSHQITNNNSDSLPMKHVPPNPQV